MSFDVMIVGIGGQGTILTSNILGEACVIEGKEVRGAETHGMAQRGGSVETQIRIGEKFGPMIAPGTADMIISFDLLETVRYRHFLKDNGKIITSSEFIVPTSVYTQDFPAPNETLLLAALAGSDMLSLDAKKMAEQAGNIQTLNVVLLGAASRYLPLSLDSMKQAIQRIVPKKTIEINLKAFELGRASAPEA